jgi:hypothetical protein
VAQGQADAETSRFGISQQLEASKIMAKLQETLGLAQTSAEKSIAETGFASAERQQFAMLDLSRYGLDLDLQKFIEGTRSQEFLYQEDFRNRLATEAQRIAAVKDVGLTYRNQSLERQGTILNALASALGQQPTYSYVSAFGGQRETFSGKLGAIVNAVKTGGGFFGF